MSLRPTAAFGAASRTLDPDRQLAATILLRYLFFLRRRPISSSNRHFLVERVAGLRSLGALFADRSDALMDRVAALVRGLTPATLAHVSREIESTLTPLLSRSAADDVLVSRRPPDARVLSASRRIDVVLGPGIGIGDEVICLPIPGWLRTAAPEAEIRVRSTRPQLWSSAAGATAVHPYSDYRSLVHALQGDGADLVVLVDFEKPAVVPGVTRRGSPARFVELSLGARSLEVFDGEARTLHELDRQVPYHANYYDFVVHALRWLGTKAAVHDRLATPRRPPGGVRTVAVSPFTSKYEPSEAAWSTLVGTLAVASWAGAVRFVFDPGPSLATERFAVALARSIRARAGREIACDVASEAPARTRGLAGVLRLLEEADVVIAADSFAAHAAPLAGCTALVLANRALRHWRVPRAPVFYFDDETAPDVVARGMRRALAAADRHFERAGETRPWTTSVGAALAANTARLVTRLDTTPAEPACAWLGEYETCAAALRELVSEVDDWPEDFLPLLADRPYHRLLPRLSSARRLAERPGWADALSTHAAHLVGQWENSNLYKYLVLAARSANG